MSSKKHKNTDQTIGGERTVQYSSFNEMFSSSPVSSGSARHPTVLLGPWLDLGPIRRPKELLSPTVLQLHL